MEENEIFLEQLKDAVNKKTEWFNSIRLQELLEQYRILSSCSKNLYDTLVKKSIITPDPYRRDKKIQEVNIPESSAFSEAETNSVIGSRFSEYQEMLDYVTTYFRFSVEMLQIPVIKKLLELNKVFHWDELSQGSSDPNTRGMASSIAQAKTNAPSVIISMIQDIEDKNASAVLRINKILNELGCYQKELYKVELRKDLFEHPEFDKAKAYQSEEAELAEIKRLYNKVMGKVPFYNELVKEIISEDLSANKKEIRQRVLKTLEIPAGPVRAKKKSNSLQFHNMAMDTVLAVTAMAPTLNQLRAKIINNVDLVFKTKNNFFAKFAALLRKAFHLKEKERICTVNIKDAKSGAVKIEKIKVTELIDDLAKKERLFTSISMKGPDFNKIDVLPDEGVINFAGKLISETQSMFTKINALDGYFKGAVDIMLVSKVKGMQIELAAMRNSIMNGNKKRGEYTSAVEESEQMKRLGVTDDE